VRSLIHDAAFQTALRASLAVLVLVASILFLQRTWPIVEPLLVSAVVATALWPWVTRLEHTRFGPYGWRLPRVIATTLVFVLTFSTAGAIIWFALLGLLPQIDRGLSAFPDQTAFLRDALQPFRSGDIAQGAGQIASDVAKQAAGAGQTGQPGPQAGAINVPALGLALFGGVLQLALVLIFTFFWLMQGGAFAWWILRLLPLERRVHAERLGLRIRDRISRWVLAQIIYGSVSGLVIWLTTALLQLPSPWLYGVIGATLGIFPGLGPWIAYVPALVVAMGMSVWQATAIAVLGVAMYIVDSTMLSTKIYGELLHLPMFVVLLALLLGAALMGVWGAMIAAPVAAGIQSVLQDQLETEGDQPPLPWDATVAPIRSGAPRQRWLHK
jgi:predicted PurR-regulated permease PerM